MGYPPQGAAAGITKLSELVIDVAKDWGAYGIDNLLEIAAGMQMGDFGVRGAAILQRLVPGPNAYVLSSQGPGNLPHWIPAPGPLNYYYGAPIASSVVSALATVDQSIATTRAPGSSHNETTTPTKSATVGRSISSALATVNQSIATTRSPGRTLSGVVMEAMGGAVADDGGVETDETAAANNATINDIILLPAVPVVGDSYYFGRAAGRFTAMYLQQSTPGNGIWTITWKYWDGVWVNLAGVVDGGSGFRPASSARYKVSWTDPGVAWIAHVIQAMNLFWVRAEVTAYTSIVTQPKGDRAYIESSTF